MFLLYPVGMLACLTALVLGWRLMRSSGLELVERELVTPAEVGHQRRAPFTRLVDRLGITGQRTLLRAYGSRRLGRLERRLQAAGRPEGLTVVTFVRRQAGFGVLAVISGVFLVLAGQPLIALLAVAVAVGWMPLWLHGAARTRQQRIASGLPDFLDILAVTVTAGLSLQGALNRVSAADSGPLGEEIRHVLDDMRYGASRRRALEALRERNDAPSMATFVTALLQAEELGTPIAAALSEIAAEVRREAAQLTRQQAAKAAPKVSLVVTTFIVPGAMVLIVSAMVLSNLPRLQALFS